MNATHIIKKFTTAAFVALAALAARSEYLYWMIEQDASSDEAIQFDYATLKVNDADYLSMYSADGTSLGTEVASGVADRYSMDEGAYALISGYQELPAGTQFLFELWRDGSDSRVGWARYTKSEVDRFTVDPFNQMAETPLAVTQPWLVPEPTSGMLLLLGVAGLALRRRRLA